MRIIAHRGASAVCRENSILAFRRARELGAGWVELDVRRTADAAMAVHHGARLADGRALMSVESASLPADVPQLAQALDACQGMGVNIEIKNWPADIDFDAGMALAGQVVGLLADRGGADDVLVSCFHLPTLDRVHMLMPSLPTAWLVEAPWDAVKGIATLLRHGHRTLHPHRTMVDAALMATCIEANIEVNVWTVDDPDEMRRLIRLGVHGICTNVPDILAAVYTRHLLEVQSGGR